VEVRSLSNRRFVNNPWLTIIILIGTIIVSNSLVVFSNEATRDFFTNLTINTAAAGALSLSIIALISAYRYRIDRVLFRAQLVFTAGLALWLVAEVTWMYYQIFLRIETPFPSLADAFWSGGYGFFIYFMFSIYKLFSKGVERYLVILVSFAAAIIMGYVLNLTFGIADLLSAQEGSLAWVISVTYPILDGILLIPAVLVLWSLRGRNIASANWSLLALSIVLVTVADLGFGYSAVLDKAGKEEWIWDLFYNSSYLVMAAAFFLSSRIYPLQQQQVKTIN
jgi:hypothetical protein